MDRAYYLRVAAELRTLCHRLHDRLSDRDRTIVEEYVSVNELGLALEHLADALAEEDQLIAADERASMLDLAALMGLEDAVGRALALCPPH